TFVGLPYGGVPAAVPRRVAATRYQLQVGQAGVPRAAASGVVDKSRVQRSVWSVASRFSLARPPGSSNSCVATLGITPAQVWRGGGSAPPLPPVAVFLF